MEFATLNDIKKDMKNLMLCIRCHEENGNHEIIKETLNTIINMFVNHNLAKDNFCEIGGINFLLERLESFEDLSVLECIIKTLAFVADENVHNQKYLTQKEVFHTLHTILIRKDMPSSLLKNILLFISTIVFRNNSAQILLTETNLIQDLIILYEHFISSLVISKSEKLNNSANSVSFEIWKVINTVLCLSVNNPLNEKNQTICSSLFPIVLETLENSSDLQMICALSSFLSLAIANNRKNQDSFAEHGGPLILKHCFDKNIEMILNEINVYKYIINKRIIEASNNLISVVDSAVLDHEKNAMIFGKNGIASLLMKLLCIELEDIQSKIRIVLTLGHIIDFYSNNIFLILQEKKLPEILKSNLLIGDADLTAASKYLLGICLNFDNLQNNIEQGNKENIQISEPFENSLHRPPPSETKSWIRA